MRKYKQVQRKEVVYSLDEWKLIEERAASVLMKTGTFIKRMSLDGHITYFYTNAVNCLPSEKDAYLAMKWVYEHFLGEKYNAPLPKQGKGSVKAIHYIQSFDPKDNIAPKLAHQIARTFARKAFGDNCKVVIATHVDRQHIHSHIIINTYGIDGRKFNDNQAALKQIREHSDRVCLAFGIKPIDTERGTGRNVSYNEWKHKRRSTSWKQKTRLEIDGLILKVKNVDELLAKLEMLGATRMLHNQRQRRGMDAAQQSVDDYTVRRGKYISQGSFDL